MPSRRGGDPQTDADQRRFSGREWEFWESSRGITLGEGRRNALRNAASDGALRYGWNVTEAVLGRVARRHGPKHIFNCQRTRPPWGGFLRSGGGRNQAEWRIRRRR